jgi:hypothetical protein
VASTLARRHILPFLIAMCASATTAVAQTATLTLLWDESPGSPVAGYMVYVGTESRVYSESHDVGPATSFVFHAAEGQAYFFAVAAYFTGHLLGPLSQEVWSGEGDPPTPDVLDPPLGDDAVSNDPVPRDPDSGDVTAWTRAPRAVCGAQECPAPRWWLPARGALTAVAPTPDGRIFVIEDGRRILVAARSVWDAGDALTTSDPAESFESIVVDPAFESTRTVYVSRITTSWDGTRDMTVMRYRDVGGTLGEGAAVITGLRLPREGRAPIAVDTAGHIYVAMPAWGQEDRTDDLYSAAVLRFNRDGTVPEGQMAMSALWSSGYARPMSLTWDVRTGGLWIVGLDGPSLGPAVGHLAAATRRTVTQRVQSAPSDQQSPLVGLVVPPTATRSAGSYILATSRFLLVTGAAGWERWYELPEAFSITAVASGSSGALFVTVRNDDALASQLIELWPP